MTTEISCMRREKFSALHARVVFFHRLEGADYLDRFAITIPNIQASFQLSATEMQLTHQTVHVSRIMLSRNSSLNEIEGVVKGCLSQLYAEEGGIFERNNGDGVCERSIVFRFAHYLQNKILDYFVDCDSNSSFERGRPMHLKRIDKERFVDIIVHKRDPDPQNDLICFEIKKWNNTNREAINKDKNNLSVLTSQYGYIYGFHISIHEAKTKTEWIIFEHGQPLTQDPEKMFEEE